ncbi:MAG: Cache 3/Cache 2 fusion domain-containing protein [Oligoflexia bacterium]|nr:Cache 3/Cache 2 fusion domain-containing protein [Oligoflexia bacterium]
MELLRNLNIKKKIVVTAIIMLLGPMFLLGGIYYYVTKKGSVEYIKRSLQRESDGYKESIVLHSKSNEEQLQTQLTLILAKLYPGYILGDRYTTVEGDKLVVVSGDGTKRNFEQGNNEFVDYMSEHMGREFVMTIFRVDHNKGRAIRLSTTVKDFTGVRKVGTELASDIYDVVVNKKQDYFSPIILFGKKYLAFYRPLFDKNRVDVTGIIFVAKNIENFIFTVKTRLQKMESDNSSYIFVVNGGGDVLMHPKLEGTNIASMPYFQEIVRNKEGVVKYTFNGREHAIAYNYFPMFNWIIGAAGDIEDTSSLTLVRNIFLLTMIVVLILGIILALRVSSEISIPIIRARTHLDLMAKKDFSIKVSDNALNRNDEIGGIARSLDGLNKNLGNHIGKLRTTGEVLAGAAQVISNGSSKLTETVKNNSDNLGMASNTVKDVVLSSSEAEKKMLSAVSAITTIEESSKDISRAVSVITEMAGQTNILAINAAIEAARAGEYGKGFAVVAIEIRELAEKSALAAKEIKNIVKGTISKVDGGVTIIRETGSDIKKINNHIVEVARSLDEISNTSKDQSRMIEDFIHSADQLAGSAREVNTQIRSFKV